MAKETLVKWLRGRIAALRGTRPLAVPFVLSRVLRAVRLALHPACSLNQSFPSSHELKCWQREMRAAHLYLALSDAEAGTPHQLVFLELANEAKEQAALWVTEARKSGIVTPEYAHDRLTKITIWLIQKCGARFVKPLLAMLKLHGLAMFSQPSIRNAGQTHPVFDVNDGLFALALLTIAVVSANASHGAIVLIGVAGLLAGAIATAAGEVLSAQTGRDSAPANPQHDELARIYHARGMTWKQADDLAIKVMADPDVEEAATEDDVEVTEVVAQTPVPPAQVALRAFFAFVAGGVVPLIPYLLNVQRYPLLMALVLSAVGVMVTGAMMATLMGRIALWGAFRALAVGVLAGVVAAEVGGWFR